MNIWRNTPAALCSGGIATPSWTNDSGLFSRLTTTPGDVNTVTPQSSLLLVCPAAGGPAACSGMPHPLAGFNFGANDSADYDAFLTWIINGTP